jgi:hypothetical protein
MTQVLFNKEPLGKREDSLGRFKQAAHMMIDRPTSSDQTDRPTPTGSWCLNYWGRHMIEIRVVGQSTDGLWSVCYNKRAQQVSELALFSGHYNELHGAEVFLRSWLSCRWSRSSPHSVRPEGSIPSSQEAAWATQNRSRPLHSIFLRFPFFFLTCTLSCLQYFSWDFLTNIVYAFIFTPTSGTCPAHFSLLFQHHNNKLFGE